MAEERIERSGRSSSGPQNHEDEHNLPLSRSIPDDVAPLDLTDFTLRPSSFCFQLHKEFVRRFEAYELSGGTNQKPLSKQERWALRHVMTHPEIGAWRATLVGPEKRRLNHPNKVIESFKRKHPKTDKEPGMSPMAKLKQANIELQEELDRLKRAGDDNRFLPEDTAKNIAGSIVRMFNSSKATTIAKGRGRHCRETAASMSLQSATGTWPADTRGRTWA